LQDTSTAAQPKEVKLPVALEKVLAFKGVRVSQVGMKPEDLERVEKGNYSVNVLHFIADMTMERSSTNDMQESIID